MSIESKTSITIKAGFIFILVFFLSIPLLFIADTIRERKNRQENSIKEVSAKWGGEQTIGGPIIALPYSNRKIQKHACFIADRLSITGKVEPKERYRGIYKILLYTTTIKMKGYFRFPRYWKTGIRRSRLQWQRSKLFIPVSDPLGLQSGTRISINGKVREFQQPDTEINGMSGGIIVSLPEIEKYSDSGFHYTMTIRIKGNRSLKLLPLARNTTASLQSSWKSPSFTGHYLPGTEKISEKGFFASWSIQHFSLPFAQYWKNENNTSKIQKASFGIEFFIPVSIYQKNERAVKYGLLFVGLTFLAFFLFEVLFNLRIHPFHYLIVGAALCLFFLLFLSLSEHIGFIAAYFLAAMAVVGINVWYCKFILLDKKRSYIIGGLLGILYGYLFILLESETYALLLGSIGLFAILGLVMYLTREVDWYSIGKKSLSNKK